MHATLNKHSEKLYRESMQRVFSLYTFQATCRANDTVLYLYENGIYHATQYCTQNVTIIGSRTHMWHRILCSNVGLGSRWHRILCSNMSLGSRIHV